MKFKPMINDVVVFMPAKPTPGPWYYHLLSQTINGGGLTIAEMSETNWQNERLRPEVEANAKLITAAPDLLEACKGLLAELQHGQNVPSNAILHIFRAAIAKAEGN